MYAFALSQFFRDNLLAYGLAAFVTTTAKGAGLLLLQSSTALQWQGGVWILIGVTVLASLWIWARRPLERQSS